MREILFRGKTIENGEWVYGDLTQNPRPAIFENRGHRGENDVIPETVGQFTGLIDKNGKKIFEHDVVDSGGHFYQIKHEIGAFMLVRMSDKTDMYAEFADAWNDDVYPIAQMYWNESGEENITSLKVIGSKWDNPELVANHD